MRARIVHRTVILTVLGLAALAATVSVRAQAPAPSQLPRITSTDVRYLGSFALPRGTINDPRTDLMYAGHAMSMAPNGDLFLAGHGTLRLCRVTVPAIGGQATLVGSCNEVPGAVSPSGTVPVLGGSLFWNGRLLASKFLFYDANNTAQASHQASEDSGVSWTPPSRVGNLLVGYYGGYMAVIPQEWRAAFGGPALTGQGILSIISRTSSGPAAFVFDPDHVGRVDPVPATPLVYYPLATPLADPQTQNELYTRDDKLAGIAFPGGTRSVLFIGSHGMGFPCYGPGTGDLALVGQPDGEGGRYCYNPLTGAKGEHAYPYRAQVWAYDANELLAVKAGAKKPWEVRPYAVWALPGLSPERTRLMRGGVAFDPVSRRIYLTEDYGDAPRVHVYEVAAGTAAPREPWAPLLHEICGDGVDNDADWLADEGCAPPPPVSVPGAPQQLGVRVRSSAVTLSWLTPIDGSDATGYVVEAGTAPGQTTFTAPLGLTTSLRVDDVGAGRYYVRVRARNAMGAGPASNEVIASIGCTSSPGRVRNLASKVHGNTVAFTWADADGCSGTSYRLAVGTAPGATEFQLSTEETRITALAQPGTYYARVTAASQFGVSAPSEEVRVEVTSATCSPPEVPMLLGATVTGNQVSFRWNPDNPATAQAQDGASALRYVLEAGSSSTMSNLARLDMGRATSLTALVPPGTYFVRVRAVNACGEGPASSERLVQIR